MKQGQKSVESTLKQLLKREKLTKSEIEKARVYFEEIFKSKINNLYEEVQALNMPDDIIQDRIKSIINLKNMLKLKEICQKSISELKKLHENQKNHNYAVKLVNSIISLDTSSLKKFMKKLPDDVV